jgi:NAD(P)-dependent dehydrogenase (short-subunit alcohol dehydrogenase family)
VVIGGCAGIGLGAARRVRSEGADVILTGGNPDCLKHAAAEIGARQAGAFDANDPAALARFFRACRIATRDGRRRIGDTGALASAGVAGMLVWMASNPSGARKPVRNGHGRRPRVARPR